MDATKLPKALRKYAARIHDVEDARKSAEPNGYWVYLAAGWQNRMDPGCHQIHEDTPEYCAELVKDAEPCDCDDCKKQPGYKKRRATARK